MTSSHDDGFVGVKLNPKIRILAQVKNVAHLLTALGSYVYFFMPFPPPLPIPGSLKLQRGDRQL